MKRLAMAVMFLGGLAAAGSDGPMFPWVNILGILVLGMFAYAANKEGI